MRFMHLDILIAGLPRENYHERMRTIRLVVEYDGTDYCGWQIQSNGPSVQAVLEEAIRRLTGENARVRGASRTDSGVHARGQVACFSTGSEIPAERFCQALNSRLPGDVAVREAVEVCSDFDPRREARRKQYSYTIWNHPARPALARRFAWHVKLPLDVSAMEDAAERLVGTRDFASFANAECRTSGVETVRTIDRSVWVHEGARLQYLVEGRSFLYNRVRNIVGTLVDVGSGRFAPADMESILAARDRTAAGQGAPPHGLCLEWIRYG